MAVTRVELAEWAKGQVLRVVRMQENARQVEASLLAKAEAGIKHPDLEPSLTACRIAINDCESLAGRLAGFAEELERRAGCSMPN